MSLLKAVAQKDVEAINKAIESGADINQRNNDGDTSMIIAAQNGHLDAIKRLLQQAPDLNVQGKVRSCFLLSDRNV